jgi:hypothetical protein
MARLKNEFSWSISRQKQMESCARKYFHTYYGSWGGWEMSATKEVRQTYILKNMTNLDLLAGEVVHEIITRILAGLADGNLPAEAEALDWARQMLRQAWIDSKSLHWREDPKRVRNLFELYYQHPPDEIKIQHIKDKVYGSLESFYRSDAFDIIRASEIDDWLEQEKLSYFLFDGVKIYIKPDFALRRADRIVIYDWKTGREDDDVKQQLACYALYGQHKWQCELERMDLFAVYLARQTMPRYQILPADIEQFQNVMRGSIRAMQGLLQDVAENIPLSREQFVPTSRKTTCRLCNFKELCYSPAELLQLT